MRQGFGNRIMSKIEARIERVTNRMTSEFKNIQPFDTEKVSPEQQLYDYEMMTPEYKMWLIQQNGLEPFLKFRDEMEQLKARRQR